MFEAIKKWFAVRSYAKSMGPKLRERYGKQQQYTPEQVRRTAQDGGYNQDYLCYALCMYCTLPDFTAYHEQHGEVCDYNAMRSEVGGRFFNGNTSFDASDVIDGGAGWEEAKPTDFTGGDSGDSGCGGDSGGGD